MKKIVSGIILLLGILSATNICFAQENVKITKKLFPDEYVREYVKSNIDKNKDGYLSQKEIANVKTITIDKMSAYLKDETNELDVKEYTSIDCTGLDLFVNAKKVVLRPYCDKTNESTYGSLKKIKTIYNLKNLKYLEITGDTGNKTYNLNKLSKLKEVVISSTNAEKITVSKNVNLEKIKATYNLKLKSVNLKNNTKLRSINFFGSALKKMTLPKNNKIRTANLNGTNLSRLQMKQFNPKQLKTLKICNTSIKKVNLKNFKKLKLVCISEGTELTGKTKNLEVKIFDNVL
jgi:hypothetical protein